MASYTQGSVWQVAAIRAIVAAAIAGGLAFFVVWAQTDNVKVLVTAGMTPFLTTLATRFGLEGTVDSRKASS